MTELEELLAPLAPAEFFASVWDQRPMHLPAPVAGRARPHLGRADFERIIAGLAPTSDALKVASNDARGVVQLVPVPPAAAIPLYQAGLTVCFTALEQHDRALRHFTAALKAQLGTAGLVRINAYWSPDGRGFGRHFDDHPVFIVQLEGRKRWRFSATPALAAPPMGLQLGLEQLADYRRAYPWARFEPPGPDDLREQTLSPGDVLYLPAGTWHDAAAEGTSFALTIALGSLPFASLIAEHLHHSFLRHAPWRQNVVLPGPDGAPTLPGVVDRFFAARLDELRAWAQALGPHDLAALWRAHVNRAAFEPGPRAASAEPPQRLALSPDASFGFAETRDAVGEPELRVYHRGRELTLPVAATPLVRGMVARRTFVAGDLSGWPEAEGLAWDDGLADLLDALLQVGALVREA
jgi:ribosomal protein L16 Arg81 hydroxylase